MSVETRGVPETVRDLLELGERGADIRRVSESVRNVVLRSNKRRFDGGAGWKGLADSTSERKSREGLDPRPLRASGELYRSLTERSAAGQVDERHPTELRIGTSVPYAGFQQGTKTQPKRDLMELTPSDRRQIVDLIENFVAENRT